MYVISFYEIFENEWNFFFFNIFLFNNINIFEKNQHDMIKVKNSQKIFKYKQSNNNPRKSIYFYDFLIFIYRNELIFFQYSIWRKKLK